MGKEKRKRKDDADADEAQAPKQETAMTNNDTRAKKRRLLDVSKFRRANQQQTNKPDEQGLDVLEGQLGRSRRLNETSKTAKLESFKAEWVAHPQLLVEEKLPLGEDDDNTNHLGLKPAVIRAVKAYGVHEWFAVQRSVIPALVNHTGGDLCVCAPTGSGKTLAYAVPIVNHLHDSVISCLGAVVLVPTRDLAQQVKTVFDALCSSLSIRVGVVTGSVPFAQEQQLLTPPPGLAHQSPVHILIATPGRLVDHCNHTPGFTLQHLHFIVIDEADRLLSQSYQQWLPLLLNRVQGHTHQDTDAPPPPHSDHHAGGEEGWKIITPRVQDQQQIVRAGCGARGVVVRKIMCSATLMTDPHQLVALQLHKPQLFALSASTTKFVTPADLVEYFVPCALDTKPTFLLRLLHHLNFNNVLCFASSVETSHRLTRLLQLVSLERKSNPQSQDLAPVPQSLVVAELTSNVSNSERQQLLEKFARKEIGVLLCSDVMARGIDIAGVRAVINYDCPTLIRTYIHRVGRTARAGQRGETYTMVEHSKAIRLKTMLGHGKSNASKLIRFSPPQLNTQAITAYKQLLEKKLPLVLRAEQQGRLNTTDHVERLTSASLSVEDKPLGEKTPTMQKSKKKTETVKPLTSSDQLVGMLSAQLVANLQD